MALVEVMSILCQFSNFFKSVNESKSYLILLFCFMVISTLETGVELRIWLKQGKEEGKARYGKKTAGKDFKNFRESV